MIASAPSKPGPIRFLRSSWPVFLAGLALIAAFVVLASEVLEAETAGFDAAGLQWAQQWRANSPRIESVMRDLSGMGSTVVLTLLTVALAGYLWLRGDFARAALIASSMALGTLVVSVLKSSIGRVRPGPELSAFVQDGLSFPSGHTSMSAIFFLTTGAILAAQHERLRERIYVVGLAALCTGLIGFSRVALGVHWPSDVLGGWTFGAGWGSLWFCVAQRLSNKVSSTTSRL